MPLKIEKTGSQTNADAVNYYLSKNSFACLDFKETNLCKNCVMSAYCTENIYIES